MSQSTAVLAVEGGNFWRGAMLGSTAALAVDEGSRQRQLTEAVDGGSRQRQSSTGSNVAVTSSVGGQRRQSMEAIFGGERCHGQHQRQQGGTEAVDGGLNFYCWQVSVERESKTAIFFYSTILHAQKLPSKTEPNQINYRS